MFTHWLNQSGIKQIKRICVPLSWVIYLLALLLFRSSYEGTLAAAVLPVFFTGWNLGWVSGGLAALIVTLLPMPIKYLLTNQAKFLNLVSTHQLMKLLLLTTIGILSGVLHDRQYATKQKHQLLNLTQEYLQRSSGLLKVIHQASSRLINTQDWRKVLPGLLKELRISSGVAHVYYFHFHQISGQFLSGDFFHSRQEGVPHTSPDHPVRRNLRLEGTNLNSWIDHAEKGMAIVGLIDDLSPREKDFLNSMTSGVFAVYPVFCGQEIKGCIGFEKNEEKYQWEKAELDALGMLAQVLGTSLNREASQQMINRRSIELDTLHLTSQRTKTELQLDVALSAILEQLFVLVTADLANIFIYKQQNFIHLTSLNNQQESPLLFSQLQEIELMRAMVEENKPLTIPDCRKHPLYDHLPDPPYGSVISLPLKAATGTIGVLNIWYSKERSFPPEEIRLLRMLANQAASAIINIEFYRAEKEQRLLENSLRKASMKLASNLELNQVLESILSQVLNLVSAQNAIIFTTQGDELKFGAFKEQGKPESQTDGHLQVNQEIAHSVLNKKEKVIHFHPVSRKEEPGSSIFPQHLKNIGLPLLLSEKILGVMVVNFPDNYPYEERTTKVLEILADQAVIALKNARLYEEERDHRQLAEALEKTGQIIKSSLDQATVLDLILAQMGNVIPYDTGNLMLMEDGVARVVRHRGYQKLDPEILSTISKISLPVTEFETLQKMISTQDPLIISDTRTDPNWVETQTTSQVLSWMGAPIIQGEEVIGFLSVNKFEKDFYQPEHGRRIAAFASQAAIAVQHARLYQSEAARREEAERLRKSQESLLQISRTISFTVEFDRVASLVISSLMEIMAVDYVLILELNEKENSLQPLAFQISDSTRKVISVESLEKFVNSAIEEEGSFLDEHLIKNKTTVIINDLQETNLISSQESQIAQLKSMIASPLLAQEKVLGILFAGRSADYPAFTHYDVQFFTGLADQTAAALERSRLFAEIKQMAVTDPLTEVYNRRGLSQWGSYEYDRAVRFKRSLSIIYFDLDHFKEVNDTFGHQAGDIILQKITNRCQNVIRNVDLLARVGGEEFLIILPETDQETGYQVAERIRQEINNIPFLINDQEIKVTISLGVTELSPKTKDLEEMISAADQAMYHAKQKGRNRTAFR